MKIKEIEYSRTSNLGQYESERIGPRVELEEREDVDQAFRTIKARVLRLHEETLRREIHIEELKGKFADEWQERLDFSRDGEYFIVKPKQFLGSRQFGELAAIIKDMGGEYVSAGKESHFKIPVSQE